MAIVANDRHEKQQHQELFSLRKFLFGWTFRKRDIETVDTRVFNHQRFHLVRILDKELETATKMQYFWTDDGMMIISKPYASHESASWSFGEWMVL